MNETGVNQSTQNISGFDNNEVNENQNLFMLHDSFNHFVHQHISNLGSPKNLNLNMTNMMDNSFTSLHLKQSTLNNPLIDTNALSNEFKLNKKSSIVSEVTDLNHLVKNFQKKNHIRGVCENPEKLH